MGRRKKAIVSALNLPGDVFLGEMLLFFTGSTSAVVENYRSILFFFRLHAEAAGGAHAADGHGARPVHRVL